MADGLFDFLKTPEGQALAGGLFGYAAQAQRGAPINSLGRGGLAGLLAYGKAVDNQTEQAQLAKQNQVRDLQMEQMRLQTDAARRAAGKEQAIQTAAQQSFRTPEQAAAMSVGPTQDGGVVNFAPGFDSGLFLQHLQGIDPLKAIEVQQKLKKDPIKLAAGETLYDPTSLTPLASAPKTTELPSAVREYQFAQNQGYKGTFEQWDRERKKAGATNVNMAVNTEKNLLGDIAGGLGKTLVEARGGAQAALSTIGTVGRLFDALDSGQVMAGPGTTFRQYGLQVGNLLGVSGKDAQEKLLNTRQAIQSLAQLELDAAQQMKGQGQITESERSIIRRAASGDIDGMTTSELRLLGGVLDRTARSKIQSYNSQVKPLVANPNAAAIAPFLAVEEPSARQAPNVLRFDAQGNPVK